ncbi:hypothetical protein SH668x_001587 [Planctomicrobium sp. SH668]|uniref:hypothetical protein n=1 Tax=Planctomicrobium sp. SH668 TaxID=3448126 RepID=UPI003F5CAAA1
MFKPLIFGLTVGSVGTLLATHYHLVRTDERFIVVSRSQQVPLRSTYADVRSWTQEAWEKVPELKEAVIKAGREDLLVQKKPSGVNTNGGSAELFQSVSQTTLKPLTETIDAVKNSEGHPFGPLQFGKITLGESTPAPEAVPFEFPPATNSAQIRTVPDPDESTLKQVLPDSAHAEAATTEQPQRGWVQNLLKSVLPQADVESQGSSESSGQAEVIPQTQPIPEAEKPIQYPAQSPSNGNESPSFPASPKRIPVAELTEN